MAPMAGERTLQRRQSVARMVVIGAAAGMVGAIAMAMYAMIAAATYQKTGVYTPMYHIASLILGPKYMMASMRMRWPVSSSTSRPARRRWAWEYIWPSAWASGRSSA